MLKQLRSRKTMKTVLKITLILIIPSFVLFYGWSQITRGRRGGEERQFEFAKIKPKKSLIPWRKAEVTRFEMQMANEQVQNEYYSILSQAIKNPQQLPDLKEMVTPSQNIQKALDNFVLDYYANRYKIIVPIEEIQSLVQTLFPRNTRERFQAYLKYNKQSEEYFIEKQRVFLKLAKAKLQIQSQARASLFECWLSYVETDEKLKAAYLVLPSQNFFDKVEVSQKELEEYFKENIKSYAIPEQINYEYVAYTLKDFSETIKVSDKEIKEYYKSKKELQFKNPKEVSGRHILIKTLPNAQKEDIEKAKQKIDKIYKEVKSSKDFARLANQYSEDEANEKIITPEENKEKEIKKEKLGGKFGPIREGGFSVFGNDFVTTVTLLKEGTLTEPLRSVQGWHIIKIEDVQPARYQTLEEVKDRIEQIIKNQNASELLNAKMEELKKIVGNFSKISALAKEIGVEVKETGLVNSSSTFLGSDIQSIAEHKDYIDDLPKGEMSEVLKNFNAVFVLSKKEIVAGHDPTLKEVKDRVVLDYKQKKSLELAKNEGEKLAKDIKTSEDLKKLAEKKGYKYGVTENYFTRLDLPTDFPRIKNFERSTLKTPKGVVNVSPTVPELSEDTPNGYVVWLLTEKVEPSIEDFKKELPTIQENILALKRETLFREFLKSGRNKFNVEINKEYLSQ